MSIMGIDPGLEGAIAILCIDESPVIHLLKQIHYDFFQNITSTYRPNHIYIEKAQAMPKQGVSAMFNYGMGFGRLLGWIEARSIPYTMVPPQTWTKEIHRGCTGKDSKAKSLQAVQRLFPTAELKPTERCRKPHMGLVDALLIAEYGRRIFR